jgi:hypothetical protein
MSLARSTIFVCGVIKNFIAVFGIFILTGAGMISAAVEGCDHAPGTTKHDRTKDKRRDFILIILRRAKL